MSIKSLLQIILFLLIIIIIGAIYFFYFYSKSQITNINELKTTQETIPGENLSNADDFLKKSISEKAILDKNLKDKEIIENNINGKNEVISKEYKLSSDKKDNINKLSKNVKNLTKEIEYVTTNKSGDILKILAESGKTNANNNDILELENVNGTILPNNKSEIEITSDFANFNYSNQNSKFYRNVIIRYENKEIVSDNLDIIMKENIVIAYGNVKVNSDKGNMKAEKITLDIITKDIKINSENKINIITN